LLRQRDAVFLQKNDAKNGILEVFADLKAEIPSKTGDFEFFGNLVKWNPF